MTALSDGITTLFNGFLHTVGLTLSPIGIAISLIALSAAWLGLIEIELMDRSGSKPRVGRH